MIFTKSRKIVVSLWFAAVLLIAVGTLPMFYSRGPGFDFKIYVNEAYHVVRGIDPFDVLKWKIQSDEYYPYGREDLHTEVRNKIIDGNAPWTYVYSLPFAFNWSEWRKWQIWEALQIVLFCVILCVSLYYGKMLSWGAFVAAAALSVGTTFTINFGSGNYIMMVAAALAAMMYCLERKLDVWAGICWAVVVIKPQDGFLLAIPLLLARRFKTMFVATAITLVATWVAAHLIGKPMLELILEVPQLKSGNGHAIHESARLLPQFACDILVRSGWSVGAIQSLSMAMGAGLCLALSWLVRKCEDWPVRFMPAVICAALWTYMEAYDRCLFFVIQIVFARRFLLATTKRERIWMFASMVLVFLSCFETVYQCSAFLPQVGAAIGWPGFAQFVFSSVAAIEAICFPLLVLSVVVLCLSIAKHIRSETSGTA